MSLKYRADIDGLRAIAVLTVIFFHANIPGFSGGFVGVDIFFVISGFLITSIIHKEIEAGQFSIARFYERRIRRIFPALFPVIFFALAVGFVLYDCLTFKVLGESITATTLFASNILFWIQTDYFNNTSLSNTKSLLHTWSLAVEEQFYIFFPLILLAINRFSKSRYFPWLLSIGLLSLLTSIYGIYTYPATTFYLVPFRAWELLFGSILAFGVIPQPQSNVQRNIFSILGLGLIVFSVLFYTSTTHFPGVTALVPVVGASLIIYTGKESPIGRFLSSKPMVHIGLISYSLYLWHWPLFTFARYLIFRELTPLEVTGILLVTLIISSLSLKYVEQPFRRKQPIFQKKKTLFTLSVIVMFVASSLGMVIYLKNGMPYRYPEANAVILTSNFREASIPKVATTLENIPITQIGTENITPSFIIWGDSHAMKLIPAIDNKGKVHGLSGFAAAYFDHPALLGIDVAADKTHLYNNGVLSFIKAHQEIKTIILVGMWSQYANGHRYKSTRIIKLKDVMLEDFDASNLIVFKAGLTRTVNAMLALGRRVVIVSDVPEIGHDAQRLFWVTNLQRVDINNYLPSITDYHKCNQGVNNLLTTLSLRKNVTIIHPE